MPYAIFPTRTDNIFIGVGNDGTFRKLAKEIGKPELGTDPRFARNKDRIANRDALRAELAAVFSQHEAEPLCNRLLAAGLPAGPVQKIDQALTNPHTIHRGDIIAKDWYKGVASPIRLERTKPSLRRTPPKFSASTPPRCWASSAIPRARSRRWSPRARSAGPSGSARLASSRERRRPIAAAHRQALGRMPRIRALRWRCGPCVRRGRRGAPRAFAYFPASLRRTLPPYHCFRLYGHLHVIRRCYRAKRR